MTDLISFDDINTEINHEPRILDLTLAERLGYDRAAKIRELIARNRAELETYASLAPRRGQSRHADVNFPHGGENSLALSGTAPIAPRRGAYRGRPGTEYWLTEGQALLICALSRTPVAAQVRRALIEVFMAFRRRQIEAEAGPRPPVPVHESALVTARAAAARAFADWAELAMEAEAQLKRHGPDLDELAKALGAAQDVLSRLRKV